MNEFDIIRRYFLRSSNDASVIRGIGDDAAVLQTPPEQQLVVSTDTMVAGVHYFDSDRANDVAYKLLAVNLSDMAAMGAQPKWFTLSLALQSADPDWLQTFSRELDEVSRQYNMECVGGDLCRSRQTVLTVQMLGTLKNDTWVGRDGALEGDRIYVSGTIGDAALALRCIKAGKPVPTAGIAKKLRRPVPRLSLGQALAPVASAMIDCSDGLLQDLQHLCVASSMGASINIENSILSDEMKQYCKEVDWNMVLTGGDDYELIFTAPSQFHETILSIANDDGLPVHTIGVIEQTSGIRLCIEGQPFTLPEQTGFDHFTGKNSQA